MIIISLNDLVFGDISRMLDAVYGSDPAYADTVLIMGYNVAPYGPQKLRKDYPGKRIVVYQLEQLFDGSKWVNKHAAAWFNGCDEIWEYDLSNLDWLRRHGIKATYRPMVYTEALRELPAAERDIDVLFYGFPTPRRTRIMSEWMAVSWDKYTTVWSTGLTGEKLRGYLARAKVVLNIHAFDKDCRQEQVRMFYPVINGCCVVSEKSPHNEFGKSIVVADTRKIVPTLNHVLKNGLWEQVGKDAPGIYKSHCEGR